ncbi:hypothetical protein FQR65_LT18677 [Abscondita terminalis]|nr:hypothetical protein FQR65_LT18677 [Abscondita terminalis]
MVGRVVDTLGNPIDGVKGPIGGDLYEMPIERKAPGVIFRQPEGGFVTAIGQSSETPSCVTFLLIFLQTYFDYRRTDFLRVRFLQLRSFVCDQRSNHEKVSGSLKLDQAAYRELEAFAKFGSDLDAVTMNVIEKGAYCRAKRSNNVLLVVVTSNRGLCGAFNANVIKATTSVDRWSIMAGKNVDIITIGKKGYDAFHKTANVIENRSDLFDALTFDNTAAIAQQIMDAFIEGTYDKVEVIYNQFKNAATQIVITEQFLPYTQ